MSPSSFNVLRGNIISEKEVGVWVAARQSRNLKNWHCGDKPYADGFYLDHAASNWISRNFIRGGDAGVILEDDDNVVRNNVIYSRVGCVRLGAKVREAILGWPVRGSRIVGNSCRRLSQ